ncbi:MAG: hypothetical protein JWR35_190 [Marmoricola sp.]|nr:hypothetical protein [Marmoricola sp.]
MDRRQFLRTGAGGALAATGLTAAGLRLDAASAIIGRDYFPKPRVPGSYRDAAGKVHSLAYFGLFQSGATPGVSEPESLESAIGRQVAINHSFRQPPEAPWAPVRDRMAKDIAAGRIPMLSYAAGEQTGIADHAAAAMARLRSIAAGGQDAAIDGQARALAALHRPVFFRFTWEFDLRYLGSAGAATHKAAWRRVRDRFERKGATNVAFVWCPSWTAFTNGRAATYYPGNDYVDWIGADGYARTPDYRTFSSMFAKANEFAANHGKPLMVGETGVHRLADQADRTTGTTAQSTWLDGIRANLDQDRFTSVKALLYFHVDGDDNPLPNQWQVSEPVDGPAFTAFQTLAAHPRLQAVR